MILVTGDTHRNIDIKKLNTNNFPEQKNLTKDDYLIILGDFGCIWDGSANDKYWRKWHNKKNYTTLFIDGNHENFHILENSFNVKMWKGGKVRFIEDSVIHLMRGQVYDIDGTKIFTMGGGYSVDKDSRVAGVSWWEQEQPSNKEYIEAIENLTKYDFGVDYVLTHTASMKNMKKMNYIKEDTALNGFFDILQGKLQYKHWYFGHFHEDINIDDRHTAVFTKVMKIGGDI